MGHEAYDVIVVGGGPAGASAAIYSARFGLKTLVIDKGLTSGALGASRKIHNYPGVPGPITGPDILTRMRAQAESFGARFLNDKVIGTDLKKTPMEVTSSNGAFSARTLILASGATGRTRAIPGEAALLGKGVSYCAVCDGAFFRNQAVAVLGGNDEALEEALLLATFADRVYVLSPTPQLRAASDLAGRVSSHPKVEVRLGAQAQKIMGEDAVKRVAVRRGGAEEILPVQGVFIYLQGNQPETEYLMEQVEILENGCIKVDGEMRTNIPGVFAVGDMLCRHIKQAVIAAAEGAMAAVAAEKHLRGRTKARLDWH
jgi:thioredoxin reductase (NADPH)